MRVFIFVWLVGVAGMVALAQEAVPKMPAGQAVTFTADQVARGKLAYGRACLDCHGEALDNGEFGGPPLRGADFLRRWTRGTVGALYAYTKSRMPVDRPGALGDQAYADLVAFILDANGYPSGDNELPTDRKAQALMRLHRD